MARSTKNVVPAATDLSTYTLLQFPAITLPIKPGSVVIFRSASIGHNDELPLYHARPAKVVADKNAQARGKVAVWFKDMEDGRSIALDRNNLIDFNPETLAVATSAFQHIHATVLATVDQSNPKRALQEASFLVKAFLSRIGMYDSWTPKSAPATAQGELPF